MQGLVRCYNPDMTIIAGVLVQQHGKYLLVQEKKQEVYGLWNIPSGHVEEGETNEEAALREGNEETGYTLELTGRPKEYQLEPEKVLFLYSAKVMGGKMKLNKAELIAVNWFSPEEIKKLKLRVPKLKELFV